MLIAAMTAAWMAMGLALGQVSAGEENQDLTERVTQLVAQLNDDDVSVRQQAEQALVALGPRALDLLPPVRDRMPQEMKLRLQRVREMLEHQAAEQAARASTVTLQGTMPLSAAIAELQKQTGNRLVDFRDRFGQPADDVELQLDLDRVPFWRAVETIFDEAGLQLYPYSGETRALAFIRRGDHVAPASERATHVGLFRMEPTRVEAIRDLRSPQIQGLRLTLEIAWEPRVTPIALSHALETLTAVGDNGVELEPTSEIGDLEAAVQNTVGAVEVDIPFELPSRDMREIRELSGTFMALMPGREAVFDFDNLAAADDVVQRRAGVTVVLQAVRQNVDVQEVRILVRFDDPSGALESHRGWIYNNDAYLLNPDGQRVDYASFETTRQQPNEIGLSYKFAGPEGLKGYTFHYTTPAAIFKTPIEYQLKNIPLP